MIWAKINAWIERRMALHIIREIRKGVVLGYEMRDAIDALMLGRPQASDRIHHISVVAARLSDPARQAWERTVKRRILGYK